MAQVILTSTGTNSWTVPADFNSLINTIEVLGAGGGGGVVVTQGSAGGGGGGYGKLNNVTLTTGSIISYTIGVGGGASTAGGDTYFNGASYAAAPVGGRGGGAGAAANGGGGAGGAGKGDSSFTGGTGGNGQPANGAAGGGGGAAGKNGNGNNGVAGVGNTTGGAGGSGDAGSGGAAGAGTSGNGGNGSEWTTAGSGGGGGGGDANSFNGGNGGTYGAGGGGSAGAHTAGNGTQGVIVITYTPTVPDDRYWVGGTGTWDTSTTHWAATSGGASGASAPVSQTANVIFDANSGGGIVTLGATALTGVNMTFTGFTGTFTGSTNMSIPGNLTLGSGMTWSYSGIITFSATSSGKTITSAGKTFVAGLIFDGVGGGWTLQDALTTNNAGSITLTNGSLSFNNFNVTTARIVSSNSNTRVLTLGSGTITLTSTGTVWSFATTTGLTLNQNTSTININDSSSSSKTFAGGGKTYYDLTITSGSTGTYSITGANTYRNFRFTGSGTGSLTIGSSCTYTDFRVDTPPHTVIFTAGTTTTVSTFTVAGTAGNLVTLQSSSSGSKWYLLSSSAVSCDYLSLQDSWAIKS